jgi:hypothetical protein
MSLGLSNRLNTTQTWSRCMLPLGFLASFLCPQIQTFGDVDNVTCLCPIYPSTQAKQSWRNSFKPCLTWLTRVFWTCMGPFASSVWPPSGRLPLRRRPGISTPHCCRKHLGVLPFVGPLWSSPPRSGVLGNIWRITTYQRKAKGFILNTRSMEVSLPEYEWDQVAALLTIWTTQVQYATF